MAYIATSGQGNKVITGYKVEYDINGRKRVRVFTTERRASRFSKGLPFGANSRLVPLTRRGRT